MAANVTSNSIGDNLPQIMTDLVLSAETIDKGLLNILTSYRDDIFIPRFNVDVDPIGAPVATPTVETATSNYTEVQLVLGDAMIYLEFNPRAYESVWRDFWPTGPTVDAMLNPQVRAALVSTMSDRSGENVDKLIWQGDTASGVASTDRWDGFLKLLTADATVIDVAETGVTTEANILERLENIIAAIPAAVKETNRQNVVIHMSHANKYLAYKAARALDVKGLDITEYGIQAYGGFRLTSSVGMPDNNMVAYVASGPKANFHAGMVQGNEYFNFKLERLQANSELYFLKALFKMGVQYTWGKEVVLQTVTL